MVDILFIGLSLGSILLLIALGLTIVYGAMGVINMAHGELVMIGAYTAVLAGIYLGVNMIVAIPLAFLVTAGLGVIIERSVIRFLYGRLLDTLLATWGIAILLQQMIRLEFFGLAPMLGYRIEGMGPGLQSLDLPHFLVGTTSVLGLEIPAYRGFILVVTGGLAVLTWALIYRTSLGTQIRAIMRNPDMAAACGIDVRRVSTYTFAYGSGLAGVAGVLLGGFKTVEPEMGSTAVVDGFMVVVVGGVGSLFGTIVTAGALGQVNGVVASTHWGNDILARAVVFALVIGLIMWRPQGLFSFRGR